MTLAAKVMLNPYKIDRFNLSYLNSLLEEYVVLKCDLHDAHLTQSYVKDKI